MKLNIKLNRHKLAIGGATLLAAFGLIAAPFMSAQASAARRPCMHRTLRYGDRGRCVKYIQIMSNAMSANRPWAGNGYAGGRIIAADGVYGPNTRYEVIVAQRWYNSWHRRDVYVDGVAGPQTRMIYCRYAFHNNLDGYWARRANHIGHRLCG